MSSDRRITNRVLWLAAVIALLLPANALFAQEAADSAVDTSTLGPGILPAFITAGPVDPAGKVPVFNGVPGSGVVNLDLPIPTTLLTHGQRYVYTVAFQDHHYAGTYSVSYSLTQVVDGTTVTLDSGTIVTDRTTAGGDYWAWVTVGKAIPESPGLATLTGTITYGKTKATTKVSVFLN